MVEQHKHHWHVHEEPTASPTDDTPNQELIDSMNQNVICSPDVIKKIAYLEIDEAENSGGKVFGNASGLYNTYQKYKKQGKPQLLLHWSRDFPLA